MHGSIRPITSGHGFGGQTLIFITQELDSKMIKRLETAVSKSEYSQGKKVKVVAKVSYFAVEYRTLV